MDWYVTESGRTLVAASVFGTDWTIGTPAGTEFNALGIDNRYGTSLANNGGVGVASRLTHLIFYDELSGGRYLLHAGGGYTFGQIGGSGVNVPGTVGSQTYRATTIPEFFVGDASLNSLTVNGTPNVLDTGRYLAHNYSLYHLELAGNAGSFHWQSEVLGTAVAQFGGPLVYYGGAYAQCGYFLTGESAGYNRQMGALDYNCVPFREFLGLGRGRRMCGWGAWEVAARWSYLDLQSNRINPLNYQGAGPIDPATGLPTGLTASNGGTGPSVAFPNPGVLNESTVGLNWYWNQFAKVQFNWIHSMLSSQYHGFSQMDIWALRYQVEF
jgi:phosphate-selective porin OprO/OprP